MDDLHGNQPECLPYGNAKAWAIQRHILARAATDHQLAIARGVRPADQGIAFQHVDRSDDVLQP